MMNRDQRKLASDLANGRITPETFMRGFGIDEPREKIPLRILEEAYRDKSAADVEYGVAIGLKLRFSSECKDVLQRLFDADWHHSHEDVISALDKLRDPDLVETFYKATQVIPAYLNFDENRALAVKAIWSLGNIGTDAARNRLKEISLSQHPRLRSTALEQLQR